MLPTVVPLLLVADDRDLVFWARRVKGLTLVARRVQERLENPMLVTLRFTTFGFESAYLGFAHSIGASQPLRRQRPVAQPRQRE